MPTRDVFQLELDKRSVVQAAANTVTGGSIFSDGLNTLKLPAGETDLSEGFGGATGLPTLTRWNAAVVAMQAGIRNAKILFLGDSTTAGFFATGVNSAGCRDLATATVFAKSLTAEVGYYGSTIGDGTNGLSTFQAYDPRWVFAPEWSVGAVVGLGGGTIGCPISVSATTTTFTPAQAFDTIDIYYIQNSGYGTLNLNVDGGATLGATINTSGSLSIAKATRSCALGVHALNLAKPIGGQIMLIGVSTYNSAIKGVECLCAGKMGLTSTSGALAVSAWDPAVSTATGTIAQIAPDLTIINLSINDWVVGVAPAIYATNIQALIDVYRLYGDVVLQTGIPEAPGTVSIANQRLIVSEMRQLAVKNGIPILDIHQIWGDYNYAKNTLGYFAPANDLVHPGSTGYAAIAASAKSLIGI